MNIEQIKKFISENVKYKDGWEFYIGEKSGCMFLQIRFEAKCHSTGNIELQTCRKYQLSEFMTETEIVRTCFIAVCRAEMHEIEELFKYRGQDIYNSHINVNKLAQFCESQNGDLFDLREKIV